MDSQRRTISFLYRLFINIFINYYLIALLLDFLKAEKSFGNTLVILGASIVAVSIWRLLFRKPIVFVLVGALSVIIVLYFKFYQGQIFIQTLDKVSDFTGWSYGFLGGLKFIHPNYYNLLLILMVFILSFITSILIYNIRKSFFVFAVLTILFMVRWFQYSDKALEYFIYYITFVLMLYSHNKYIQKEDEWKKEKKEIKPEMFRRWLMFSTALCMVLVLISTAMPRNFKPVSWRWLDNQVQQRFPSLQEWRNNKKSSYGYGNLMRFDLSLTDYQGEEKRLGGPVDQKGILVMTVRSQEPIYLKGRVKDFYTGSYWKATKVDVFGEAKGVDNSLVEDKKIEGETINITISHKNLITSSLFNTYIPKSIKLDNSHYYITEAFETFSSKLILQNKPYSVSAVKPYVDWDKIKSTNYRPKDEFVKYLQIPDDFPERVTNLSKEISSEEKSDYEKVKSLERYLRDNFPYTLEPPETPHNRDFVDHFLFDVKEGYCTYYATSLTMMARSLGVPARYVEGFKISRDSFKEFGSYYVYSDNAHAWAEVYIEGYGWMVFEGTPGYSSIVYEEKMEEEEEDVDRSENSTNSAIEIDRNTDKLKDLFDDLGENTSSDGAASRKGNITEALRNIFIIIILILLGILTMIIFNYYKIKRLFVKISNKNNRDRILDYYKFIMNLLDYIHKEKREGETVLEYSNRLNLEIWEVKYSFNEVSDIFSKARYSNENISDEEVNVVWNYFIKTEIDVNNKVGRLRYFAFKYFKMGISK